VVLPLDVFFQVIEDPSVKTVEPEPRMVNVVKGEDWRALIMAYLHHHYEPDNNTELTRMQQRAKSNQIIRDKLYKTSVTGPLLHYLSRDEGKELLTQTHLGVCGGHIGARALTAKVFRQGFYWPSIIDDASKLITTCQACQFFFAKYSSTISSDYTFMAATKMGHRHCRAIDNSSRKLQICSGGGGILNKVNRGEASCQYSSSGAQKVFW
jgi:hypothetical protein